MSMCSLSKDLKRAVWSTWLVFPSVDCNYYFQVMFMKVFQKLCESHLNVDMLLMRRRQWHPTPVLLPRKSHRRRSLVGCSPWGHKESDMTERLHFHFSLSCSGEGNGNPLLCSCLENPRDGGAWWAAVYGVTQSRTRLKWFSSSSSSMLLMITMISKRPDDCKKLRNKFRLRSS